MVSYTGVHRVARTGTSLVITIPKDVIDRFNIHKGDYLKVSLTPEKELGIRYEND